MSLNGSYWHSPLLHLQCFPMAMPAAKATRVSLGAAVTSTHDHCPAWSSTHVPGSCACQDGNLPCHLALFHRNTRLARLLLPPGWAGLPDDATVQRRQADSKAAKTARERAA
jgi:hypothetical protein